MIDTRPLADVANAERFERIGVSADAVTASQTRDAFARWLQSSFDLDRHRVSDLILAVNEALANCAEHAYPAANGLGTTDVLASHDSTAQVLTVVISDRGVWQVPQTASADRNRGRGIPLMTALADRADIETSSDGTLVSLSWVDVSRR